MRKFFISIFCFFIVSVHIPDAIESYLNSIYRVYQFLGINTTMSLYQSDLNVRGGNKFDSSKNKFYIELHEKGRKETVDISKENFYSVKIPYDWYVEKSFYNKKDISNYFCKYFSIPGQQLTEVVVRDEMKLIKKMRYVCF